MKQISTAAGFSQIYTNHCVRATAITVWTEAGLSDRQICHISGHKNPASLRHYNSRPSNDQLRQCSDALSDAMQDQNSLQQLPKQQLPLRAMSFQRNESSSTCTQVENILGGMFNSCSVKGLNIQINVNSFPQDQKYTLKLLFWKGLWSFWRLWRLCWFCSLEKKVFARKANEMSMRWVCWHVRRKQALINSHFEEEFLAF